jgi:pimeloyl-ACP methyl ester carboxylesterase
MPDKPNIVLVHGAWGDASHWPHVIPLLYAKGYRAFGVQNPLTSLSDDIDRTSKLVAAHDAPTLLVGHAYGCAVITGDVAPAQMARLLWNRCSVRRSCVAARRARPTTRRRTTLSWH